MFARHSCAKERKKRWSGVRPSTCGRDGGLPRDGALSQRHTPEVGEVLAEGELAVHVEVIEPPKAVELGDQLGGGAVKRSRVLGRPPIAQRADGVEGGPGRRSRGSSWAITMWLSQAGLGLPDRESYLEDNPIAGELRAAYVEHIGAQLRNAGVEGDAAAVLAFETRLAELHWRAEERRDTDRTHNRLEVDAGIGGRIAIRRWKSHPSNVLKSRS